MFALKINKAVAAAACTPHPCPWEPRRVLNGADRFIARRVLFLLHKGKRFFLKENQLLTNHLQMYVCVQKHTMKMKTTVC